MTQAQDEPKHAAQRLRWSTDPNALSVDLVSALSGERQLTPEETDHLEIHRAQRGHLFYSDLFYALAHVYFAPERAEPLWQELLKHKKKMTRLLGRRVGITVAALDFLSELENVINSPTLISEAYVAELASRSMRDGLTGLYNHSTFYELLELELVSHRRNGSSVALIMIDIDDFKVVNDLHGHPEGDRTLVELADTITTTIRGADICCRLGGEEFAVIMPFTQDYDETTRVAEKIRTAVANLPFDGREGITISLGVAVCSDDAPTTQTLVERADEALYLAKARGKNRVVSAAGQ